MKKSYLLILLYILISSCQIIKRDDEAIKLVKETKFGIENVLKINAFLLISNPNPTNLEMANQMANSRADEEFIWIAKHQKDNVYLVVFVGNKTPRGLVWEANLDNQIVRNVTYNESLAKKYKIFD